MGQWCVSGGGGSGRSMAIRVPRVVVWHYGHEIISQPHRDKEKKGKNVRLDFRCWAEWSRALLSQAVEVRGRDEGDATLGLPTRLARSHSQR